MSKQCLSIPGIRLVGYLGTLYLPHDVTFRAESGVPVKITNQPISISLKGEAVCEMDSKFDHNSMIETAKLTFYTLEELPLQSHLAFVFSDINGDFFVIGAREAPYPTVKVSRTTGTPDGDTSVRKYEVSFTARKALAPCTA